MCLIIINENNQQLDIEMLRDAIDINSDGAGVIDVNGNIQRWIKPDAKIIADYCDKLTAPYALHLRFATVGDATLENTHPHRIDNSRWLMHNGTVKAFDKRKSDSATVAKLLCQSDYSAASDILMLCRPSRFCIVDVENACITKYGPNKGANVWVEYYPHLWVSNLNFEWFNYPVVVNTSTSKKTNRKTNKKTGKKTDNVIDDSGTISKSLLFAYGTLKHGRGNSGLLKNSELMCDAVLENHILTVEGSLPYCHPSQGDYVEGELYMVEGADDWKALDDLEGHPYHYHRAVVSVSDDITGKQYDDVIVYLATHELDNAKPLVSNFGGIADYVR